MLLQPVFLILYIETSGEDGIRYKEAFGTISSCM